MLQGFLVGLVPINMLAAAVQAAGDERPSGAAMVVVILGQNAGMLLGPMIFGGLVQAAGWPVAFLGLSVIALTGILAGNSAKVH